MMSSSISATELKRLIDAGNALDLIDVRTPAEFESVHVQMAKNVPLDQLSLNAIQGARMGNPQSPLYVVCRSGARGRQACERLTAAGMPNVINVEGGTMACEAAGVGVVKGKQSISLPCQVQIIVGSLTMAGGMLTYFHHMNWIIVPAMMGAGLLFSGLTDTCVLGAMLSKMPWNRPKNCTSPTNLTASSTPTCCSTK